MTNVILELTRIVQEVALTEAPTEQVRLMVDSISQALDVDVCTLYRVNEQGDMVMLASHGLADRNKVVIPAGKGLVGLVARARHAINLADAEKHPDYYYVKSTHEEQFKSFCGVPLVRAGDIVGVLVVQRSSAEKFSDECEAFLVTLAAQLAMIVAGIPLHAVVATLNLRTYGIKSAPGIGIGKALLCDRGELYDVDDAPCQDADAEIVQWQQLLAHVLGEINDEQALLGDDVSDTVKGIFDAYRMLLSDQSLTAKVETEIREGHCLPYALRLAIQYFTDFFKAMDDPYLKARQEDIQHLGNKLFKVWRGDHGEANPYALHDGPIVLVGAQVSVSDIASVPPGKLAGVVCFEGSRLSHASILANAIGAPAVMGVGKQKHLKTGETVVVDGNEGQIIVHPNKAVLAEFKQLVTKERRFRHQLDELRDLPAVTQDGTRVDLFTNTGLLADITPGLRNGAEGVGLYRTEIPFIVRESFPTEDEQVHTYRKVFEAYAGKPVYIRTLDIGGDKQLPYFPITAEENPALGWRGIRFTLDNIQLLMTQVRAIVRAAGVDGNLHILLPMVSATSEVVRFRKVLDDACSQLTSEGIEIQYPKVGVMIEVPAAISQLPFWQDKLDFISIGSNDLSQYLLALDRNNARVASRYDHVHPAVLHEIYRIVKVAESSGLMVSLCGEMASDPVGVMLLVGMGVRRLSMSSAKIPLIKWLIRSLSLSEASEFLQIAMQQDDVDEIRRLGTEVLQSLGLNALVA